MFGQDMAGVLIEALQKLAKQPKQGVESAGWNSFHCGP